jgi:asparagine synthase (glutamine-hydrolysing)
MCGIFAYYSNNENTELIKQNFEVGKHRGPESSNTIIIDNIFLGFHRLAINGLNNDSNQPFNINGIYLICNGEIYNYSQLFTEFEKTTDSDCEIIIHMYLKYGIEYTLDCLDGVFAFVLYDSIKKLLISARDPYGVRPLYYLMNNKELLFASELKQFNGIEGKVDYFPPGSYYINGKLKKYTSFPFNQLESNNNDDYYTNIYSRLEKAVKKRVIGTTDRPIACLLSGGLDSSIITAMVNELLPKRVLETYSIGLTGSVDVKNARIVADYLGTKHTEIIIPENDFFNAIPEVIKNIESYDVTTVRASVGNYLIGKYISKYSNCKVIFNGDGSDELTGGYLYFNKCPDSTEFDRETKRLLTDIHMYDVLRSDKCISSNGLEPRTPFLDRGFVEYYLSIPKDIRFHGKECEKYLLRKSVEYSNPKLIPREILYRRKEAFSDGVSSENESWYSIIQKRLKVSEKEYYLSIFESAFPGRTGIVEYYWMPRYVIADDPSARTLKEYSEYFE